MTEQYPQSSNARARFSMTARLGTVESAPLTAVNTLRSAARDDPRSI
jgi:hypothetical protein